MLLWVLVWLGLGVTVSRQVGDVGALAATVSDVGITMNEAARSLSALAALPLVGANVAPIVESARQAAASAAANSQTLRSSIATISLLLGVYLTAVPILLVLALYLPIRISRAREVGAIRHALSLADPVLDEFLARRAARNLPFHVLREVTAAPWRDLEEGRFRALADAELARLGIRRSS